MSNTTKTIYDKTDRLGLDLYGDNDPADLRDGHNDNMRIIDKNIGNVIDSVGNVTNSIGNLHNDYYKKPEIDQKLTEIKTNTNADLALKADKSDTYTKSETDQEITNIANHLIPNGLVWIGDSWSGEDSQVSGAGLIPKYVAGALHMDLHNYARGASGITQGGANSFGGQAKAAVQDSSVNPDSVGLVVIFGGINDRYADPNQIEINTLYATLVQHFTRAKIVCIPMQKAANGNDWGKTAGWINAYMHSSVPQVAVVSGAWYWDFANPDDFTYTNPGHPNKQGCITFASKILTALTGGNPGGIPKRIEVKLNSHATANDGVFISIIGDGTYRVYGHTTFAAGSSAGDWLGQIPEGFYTDTGSNTNLLTPFAQYGKGVKTFATFTPDPYREAPSAYVGRPLAIKFTAMEPGETYWFGQTFPILQP